MRRPLVCVPTIALCLLLCGCGGEEQERAAQDARAAYQAAETCEMTAEVSAFYGEERCSFTLRCAYTPEESEVEVLAPETAAGVRAVLSGDGAVLEYAEDCLPAGTLSAERLSPVTCLPRLMSALRDGWLLEENREEWDGEACLRLGLEQTGADGASVVSTLWLREDGGTPVRGEIAVDGKIFLQAEFTDFRFGAILDGSEAAAGSGGE